MSITIRELMEKIDRINELRKIILTDDNNYFDWQLEGFQNELRRLESESLVQVVHDED